MDIDCDADAYADYYQIYPIAHAIVLVGRGFRLELGLVSASSYRLVNDHHRR
jgi:hypothetical protein